MTIDCELFVVKNNIIIGWYWLGQSAIAQELTEENGFRKIKEGHYIIDKKALLKFLEKAHEEKFAYVDTPYPEELQNLPDDAVWQVVVS